MAEKKESEAGDGDRANPVEEIECLNSHKWILPYSNSTQNYVDFITFQSHVQH